MGVLTPASVSPLTCPLYLSTVLAVLLIDFQVSPTLIYPFFFLFGTCLRSRFGSPLWNHLRDLSVFFFYFSMLSPPPSDFFWRRFLKSFSSHRSWCTRYDTPPAFWTRHFFPLPQLSLFDPASWPPPQMVLRSPLALSPHQIALDPADRVILLISVFPIW